jgi:DNA-binding response OmpR family regulator
MGAGISGDRIIWIISAEQWPRAMLRAELIEQGYDAVGYLTIDQTLIELSRSPGQKPQIIILDLNGQEITRARLCALLGEGIPVVILGGAVELASPLLGECSWAGILRRPFMIRQVVDLIKQVGAASCVPGRCGQAP